MAFDWGSAIQVKDEPAPLAKETTGVPFDWQSAKPEPPTEETKNQNPADDGLSLMPYEPIRENFIDVIGKAVKSLPVAGPISAGEETGLPAGKKVGEFNQSLESTREQEIARSQAVYSIAQATGLPLSEVDMNFDKLRQVPKVMGFHTEKSDAEMAQGMLFMAGLLIPGEAETGALIEGGAALEKELTTTMHFLKNPKETAIGLLRFAAIDKLIPTQKLIPRDTPTNVRNTVLALDFIGKGIFAAVGTKQTSQAFDDIVERFTLNKLQEHRLPTTVRLEPHQVRDIWQTGELTTAEEKELYTSLNLTREQIRTSIDQGITIEVPAQKLLSVTDKPLWAKIKKVFGIEPTETMTTEMAGKAQKGPKALIGDAGAEVTPAERAQELFTPNKSLTPEQTQVEQEAMKQLEENFDGSLQSYLSRTKENYGTEKVASADEAKYVFGVSPEHMASVHEPSSALAEVHREMILADKKTEGQPVGIMAGGSGAGKTHMLRHFIETEGGKDYAGFFDTNSNSLEKLSHNIDMVKASGRPAVILYVERDPLTAWDSVIERGQRTGRPVPADIHVRNQGSREAIKQAYEKYKDDPLVDFVFYDNNGKKLNKIAIENIPNADYTSGRESEKLNRRLNEKLEERIREGKLTRAQAEAYRFRKTGKVESDSNPDKPSDSGKLQQTPSQRLEKNLSEAGMINPNVIPGFAELADGLQKSHAQLKETITPYAVNDPSRFTAETIRESLGKLARAGDKNEAMLAQAWKKFDRMPTADKLLFMDRMELGNPQADPDLQPIADQLRKLLDETRDRVIGLGTGKLENWIENYFPHIWEDPKKAVDVYAQVFGKKPLEGSKSFLKKRTIESIQYGIDKGLKPVTYNPVELVLLKTHEMGRYIAAHESMNALKEEGLVKFSKGKAPEGFTKIDDKIATVYSKNEAGELILRGHYFAQKDAARIINNYLSPGLHGNFFFDAFRAAGNARNQFQLGLSAFHLGFTTIDAMVSRFSLGIYEVVHGNVPKGLKTMASTPVSPITNLIKGDKLLKAWLGKPTDASTAMLAEYMASAGGRAKQDKFYVNEAAKKMKKALDEGKWFSALLQIPFKIIEKVAQPLLGEIVPRQKLGVFSEMMRYEMENNPNMSHAELRTLAQKAWDSVDNRMGQLVYDNLFWKKTHKDLAMISMRSVGWNLGTIRELGGGVLDAAKMGADMAQGKKPTFTHKMAYLLALPIIHAVLSAIYQYLHTGKGPQETKDYFYPKTGRLDKNGQPARTALPDYIRDIYHYGNDPVQTVENKFSPEINTIIEMIHNKDFYGVSIRNEDDPFMKQVLDEANFYFVKQNIPFGIRNANQSVGNDTAGRIEPFFGLTPAPYDINMTKAEKRAHEIVNSKIPVGARTQAAADKSTLKSQLLMKFVNDSDEQSLQDAVDQGKITEKEMNKIIDDSTKKPLERLTKYMTAEEVGSVLQRANKDERETLIPVLERKIQNKMNFGVDEEEQARLEALYKKYSGA